MGGRKKQFIDKKHAVKFQLVHRSQKDPLFLDERLGEHVLLPVDPNTSRDLVALVNGLNMNDKNNNKMLTREEEIEKRRLEQHKYGIYYDDDYNYLQHLKEVDDEIRVEGEMTDNQQQDKLDVLVSDKSKPKLQLPSSVFASAYEENVGYFNLNAPDNDPKIDWDPDIVETLDEDTHFDFDNPDNQLDDDFFVKAQQDTPNDDVKKKLAKNVHQGNEWSNDDDDDDDDDDSDDDSGDDSDDKSDSDSDTYKGSNGNDFFENQSLNEFETKSRFTDYSMTSSIIRRNDKLQHLDKHFESIYSQYDEDQIGALDVEDIDGYRDLNNLVLQKALEEMDILTTKVQYKTEKYANNMKRIDENDDVDSNDDGADDEDEYEYIYVKDEHDDDRFDCESILDTYSTTNNLPHVIRDDDDLVHRPRIRISKKTGVPIVDSQQKSLKKTLKDMQKNEVVLIVRKANETKEEKKQRKQAVKEQRRERRSEKKLNKLAFKEEKKIQMKNIKNLKEFSNTVKLT